MRISDWSSDVCSSDLLAPEQIEPRVCGLAVPVRDRMHCPAAPQATRIRLGVLRPEARSRPICSGCSAPGSGRRCRCAKSGRRTDCGSRSEEHTSELQSLMRISYAVFCLKTKKITIDLIDARC